MVHVYQITINKALYNEIRESDTVHLSSQHSKAARDTSTAVGFYPRGMLLCTMFDVAAQDTLMYSTRYTGQLVSSFLHQASA